MVISILGMRPRVFAIFATVLSVAACAAIAVFTAPLLDAAKVAVAVVSIGVLFGTLASVWMGPSAIWYANAALIGEEVEQRRRRRR